jgi:hypothetical protein
MLHGWVSIQVGGLFQGFTEIKRPNDREVQSEMAAFVRHDGDEAGEQSVREV